MLLATWILFGALTTSRCQEGACQLVAGSATEAHRLAVFATPAQCEEYRRMFAAQPPTVVQTNRPGMTVRKDIAYSCKAGGPTP